MMRLLVLLALISVATPTAGQSDSVAADGIWAELESAMSPRVYYGRAGVSQQSELRQLKSTITAQCSGGYDPATKRWKSANYVDRIFYGDESLQFAPQGSSYNTRFIRFPTPGQAASFGERLNAIIEGCRTGTTDEPDAQTLTHKFRSGDHMLSERGYAGASIGLVYRFIHCMGEIHIAYSLDPKTLKHSEGYYLPAKQGGRKEYVRNAPPATPPISIPIDFDVRWSGSITVATVRDDAAGQSLGMGCFTGQTRKLGTVKDLIGPKASLAYIKEWMSKLHIGRADTDLPFALTGLREPIVSEADQARKNAEAEQAKVDAVNADALKAARDQSAKIDAQIAAGKKAQADYQAAVDTTRRQADAIAAENARKQREYQARMATHAACVAGDKAACARYAGGQ